MAVSGVLSPRNAQRAALSSCDVLACGSDTASRPADSAAGMQQRLALARAMLPRPALLFLDQPTAGLDPSLADALRRELAVLAAEEDVTIFLTTETLADAEQICERIGLMHSGQLVAEDSPERTGAARRRDPAWKLSVGALQKK